MSEIAIRCEGLGKQYSIGKRERYQTLRDKLTEAISAPIRRVHAAFSRNGHQLAEAEDTIWALKDVSFEVKHGEVVGVIGRNGAGKSTLLKILSRITEPTTGQVSIHGRVGSLLEVGTGFHPELSGRENIYLNGAILGMGKEEIARKFDEIVAFAEIEKFLDTPVKHYSSGMHMRLAFAVAAHLETDILMVDEVLAVGDAEFQRKCLGKMQDVSGREGRTVFFVSHNMAAVTALTTRALSLRAGRVDFDGPTADAVNTYLRQLSNTGPTYVSKSSDKPHQIVKVEIPSLDGSGVHISGNPLRIRVIIYSEVVIQRGCLSIQIINESFQPILHLRAYDHGIFFGDKIGYTTIECELPQCCLNVGRFALNTYVSGPPGGDSYEHLQAICPFSVDIHNNFALFGWRPQVCAYIVPEIWQRKIE